MMVTDEQDIAFIVYDTLGDALISLRRLEPDNEVKDAVRAITVLRAAMWREFQDRHWVVDYWAKREGGS